MDDIKRLEVRCLLAEARCRVYELESDRTTQALEVRFVRSRRTDVDKAQRRLDEIYGKLKLAQAEVQDLKKRAAALGVAADRGGVFD